MSIGGTASSVLHLFIVVSSCIDGWSAGALQMSDLLFLEKRTRYSSLELVKEFFNRTLLPSCDVTANVCDTNCCSDQDCGAWDVEAFNCTEDLFPEGLAEAEPLSCYGAGLPQHVHPVLCYELDNSPYLGSYFPEILAMKRSEIESTLLSWFGSYPWSVQSDHELLLSQEAEGSSQHYKHGSPLRRKGGSPLTLPGDQLGKGYCSPSIPVRYLVDTSSFCTSNISPESCGRNEKFNLESYARIDNFGDVLPPDVHSGNDSFQPAFHVVVSCEENEHCEMTEVKRATYHPDSEHCLNVVAQIEYSFNWHENYITSVHIYLALSNVSTSKRPSIVPSNKSRHSHVTQTFHVVFLRA